MVPWHPTGFSSGVAVIGDAGWSSPVARQAHNLKVVGSNPAPATKFFNKNNNLEIWIASQDPENFRRVAHW